MVFKSIGNSIWSSWTKICYPLFPVLAIDRETILVKPGSDILCPGLTIYSEAKYPHNVDCITPHLYSLWNIVFVCQGIDFSIGFWKCSECVVYFAFIILMFLVVPTIPPWLPFTNPDFTPGFCGRSGFLWFCYLCLFYFCACIVVVCSRISHVL